GVVARVRAPTTDAVRPVEACEQARIRDDRHLSRLARLERYALEADQAEAFLARRVREVDLRHVRTRTRSRVLHLERHRDSRVASEVGGEVVVLERGVAEAMTEGEQRSRPPQRVPAVADFRAFVIAH